MANPEIVKYVQAQLARGASNQLITDTLVKAGWPAADVQEAFASLAAPVPAAAPPPVATPVQAQGRASSYLDEPGLGALIYEKRVPLIWRIGSVIISLFLVILGGYGVMDPSVRTGAGIALGIGLLMTFATLMQLVSVLRVYERGIEHRGLKGTAALRDDEISSLGWSEAKQYTEKGHVYVSTQYQLQFHPIPGHRVQRVVRFMAMARNADPELDALCQRIATTVGARLTEELERVGKAAWTPNLSFSREGLAYNPEKIIGTAQEKRLSWGDVEDWKVEEGAFEIYAKGLPGEAWAEGRTSALNFFPGLVLLENRLVPK